MKYTPFLALKIIKKGVMVYFGPPFYGYALNYHFVHLTMLGTRPLSTSLFYLYATTKSEIHIFSNKHETDLVVSKCNF